MTTFTLTGTFTHQNGITPISKSPIHVHADPFPLGSTVQTDRIDKVTDANGTVTFTLTTGVTGLYYVVRSTAKRPLFKPIRFLAPAAGTVLNINTLIFYNPGDPPLQQDLIAIRDASLAAVSSVKIGTWQATTAYVTGQTVQAPDGSLIKANSSRTSRASFDATEQTFWTPVAASTGTLEQVANAATYANKTLPAFGTAGTGTARIPFSSTMSIDASAAGVTDKVAHELNSAFTGNFAASTGSNPTFGFGFNAFTHTGTAVGDCAGATICNAIEVDVATPAGGSPISVVQGLIVQAAFFSATAGATVGQMESLRVAAPVRKDGATAGTVSGTAYSLLVEAAVATDTGAAAAFSVFVAGGISRFGGRLDVTNTIANADGTNDLGIFAGFANADGGAVKLRKAANGGHVDAVLATASSAFRVSDGTTNNITLRRDGIVLIASTNSASTPLLVTAAASPSADLFRVAISGGTPKTYIKSSGELRNNLAIQIRDTADAANLVGLGQGGLSYLSSTLEQTTVGATGTAAAPPANPVKYLKVVDSTGATLVIPAYNH